MICQGCNVQGIWEHKCHGEECECSCNIQKKRWNLAASIGQKLYGKNHKWEDTSTIADIIEILEAEGYIKNDNRRMQTQEDA